ncbi:MAG: transcription termination/antitermination factor NusG [Spirochaetales bacterium]|jgi:transcriptional antiterminator NusG|nr:transcription termination/antitermination factor NusG [Spirochaetales bacterium]
MAKGWYVLHTYSGYENKIEKHVRKLMEDPSLSDVVLDIKIPSEEVVEVKDGKKKITSRKFLPGYILLEMDLPDRGWKNACSEIKKIQGVTGFVGALGNVKPNPISSDEVRSILQKTGELKASRHVTAKQVFNIGESVKIVGGPFDSFTGKIDEVNMEKGKLRVVVGIFGRATPVEVDFSQVEQI